MIQNKPNLVLVGAVEDVLPGEPLCEDEVEGGLAGGAGHGTQEVEHGRQLAVDQLRVHHQQTLSQRDGRKLAFQRNSWAIGYFDSGYIGSVSNMVKILQL